MMYNKQLLQEMQESIGTKDPIVFFSQMVNVFDLLFNKIEQLEQQLSKIKNQSALSIQWDPKLALIMIAKEINNLRVLDKETYASEIAQLKQAYSEDKVTQSYPEFCQFWENTLGWHPFIDYK